MALIEQANELHEQSQAILRRAAARKKQGR
jgi:hypothetical protein